MDIYHILKYFAMIFQRNIRYLEDFFVSLNDQLGRGQGHNSQFIVLTDYNLLFEGEEQVEICFTAHHEWIDRKCNESSSEFVKNNPLKTQ